VVNLTIADLDRVLRRVSKPARYSGGEWNSVVKDWSHTPLRVALAYPDVYDIGMSNLGLAILTSTFLSLPNMSSSIRSIMALMRNAQIFDVH
jgi:hypothetical protein